MPSTTSLPNNAPSRRWLADWKRRIACSTPAMETVTTDPFTVLELLAEGARVFERPLITWDVARGFRLVGTTHEEPFIRALSALEKSGLCGPQPSWTYPFAVLSAVRHLDVRGFSHANHAVFALFNFYPYFDVDEVRQEFDNLVSNNELSSASGMRPIHFIQAPYGKLGLRGLEAVHHHMEAMALPLPDAIELLHGPVAALRAVVATEDQERGYPQDYSDYSENHFEALASACVGLTRPRATAQLFHAVAKKDGLLAGETVSLENGETLPPLVNILAGLVAEELARTRTIEIVPENDIVVPEHLAGVERAIASLEKAAIKFTPPAEAQYLDRAKGLYLCGLEGSGKTALACAAASIFERATGRHWKTLRVDMSAFFGGLYGETEQNWAEFEARVAAIGECICIFDELDKSFSGIMNPANGAKVEQSLFKKWLEWMGTGSKRGRVYPILCMNDPSGIPREALRAGRLDGGFYFDKPDAPIRTAIARIHFAKRLKPLGLTLEALGWSETEWTMLGERMEDYLPGEIELIVSDARDVAFDPDQIKLPTFNQTMVLIDDRRKEINDDSDAREDHKKRMEAMVELRKRCRSMGARPVHVPENRPAAAPASATPGRGRTRAPRVDLN